jgi:hypothetical protein
MNIICWPNGTKNSHSMLRLQPEKLLAPKTLQMYADLKWPSTDTARRTQTDAQNFEFWLSIPKSNSQHQMLLDAQLQETAMFHLGQNMSVPRMH